jgi:SPP1 gp7 family putative phage head morphogenesis protein
MAWDVSAEPLRFTEAVAWFRARLPLSDDEFYALEERARRKAFTVSAVAQLDMVAMVQESLEVAIAAGVSYADGRGTIGPILEREWAGSVENPGNRLDVIFRTNTQLSYSAGRYQQLSEPAVMRARPYRMYDAIADSRTTPICNELNGTVLPAGDPWWDTHVPPLHFSCRSGIRSLRASQAEERGITESAPNETPQDGFGLAPGRQEWAPNPAEYPPSLWSEFQARAAENG